MMTRSVLRLPVSALGLLALCLLLGGCGGGSAGTTPGQPPDAAAPAPPPDAAPGSSPGGPASGPHGFDVTITSTGLIYVDDLELEANRRRGIYEFIGFYQDRYDQAVRIPFSEVTQIDFLGPMPQPLFDVIKETREDMALHREHCFETYITLRNGDKQLFYAWIPKLRGYKDFQPWEFSLNSTANAIQKIEFNR